MSPPPRSRAPRFTLRQKQKLKQWLADGKQWISIDEVIQLIETQLATTRGHAQKLWKDARASGEVRVANDDKLKDPGYDYACRKDDLVGWLDRREPPSPPPSPPSPPTKQRHPQPQQNRARRAIEALQLGELLLDQTKLPNPILCKQVSGWLKAECEKQNVQWAPVGDKSILRAAGRLKDKKK